MGKAKVLVVEDSPVAQLLLRRIIESDPRLEVLAVAGTGEEALRILQRQTPDVVTVDINLPGIDGFQLTQTIMQRHPLPIVIISSHSSPEDVAKSFHSLEYGAIAVLNKPHGPGDPSFEKKRSEILESIVDASLAKEKIEGGYLSAGKIRHPSVKEHTKEILAIGIGGSLGGPQALKDILTHLPGKFPVPIYVVQHISPGFAQGMTLWLQRETRLQVRLARHQERGLPGCVYIAPDGHHMLVSKENVIQLIEDKLGRYIQPAVACLFESLANGLGKKAVGVILTGMGRDGAAELKMMKEAGAVTIAQDEASCVIYGMPQEAVRLGGADHILSLTEIPVMLEKLVYGNVKERVEASHG